MEANGPRGGTIFGASLTELLQPVAVWIGGYYLGPFGPCLGHFVASDTSRFGSRLDADVLALESTKVPMRFKLKSRDPFTFAERVRRQGS